jgi:hypothetical protein
LRLFCCYAVLIIFDVPSQAEAESIVAQDPAVKPYVFQAQVRPFEIHFLTNKFDAGLARSTPPAKNEVRTDVEVARGP